MSSVYDVLSFADAARVLEVCNVTFTPLRHFTGNLNQYHILMKSWKESLDISKPRNLSRFTVVPYVPILPPAPMVMLPALPANANAAVRAIRDNLERRRIKEDEHRMKRFFMVDDNQDEDCIVAINLMKALLSPAIKNSIDVQLASIPAVLNKLERMLLFLSTTYSPSMKIDISNATSRMNTVNDQYGVELMMNVIDNERAIRIAIPLAEQYSDATLKTLVFLGIKGTKLKSRIDTWCITFPGGVVGGAWGAWTYEEVCSNIRELLKNTPDIESNLPVMKGLSTDINVNQANLNSEKRPLFTGQCHHCGKVGHLRRNCPDLNSGKSNEDKRVGSSGKVVCPWCKLAHGGARCYVKERDLAANPNALPHKVPAVGHPYKKDDGKEKMFTKKEAKRMFLEEDELAELRASKKSKKDIDSRSALKAEIMKEIEAKYTAGGSK